MTAEVLLDTHAFVWAITAPDRLGQTARETIEDRANTLRVSAATVWEMAIKLRSGRWPDVEPLVAEFEAVAARLGTKPVAISPAHALRAGLLPWDHRDPFDRMLAAQATIEQWPLVTRDTVFEGVPGLATIW